VNREPATQDLSDPAHAPSATGRREAGEQILATPAQSRSQQVLNLFLAHHTRLVNFLTARVGFRQDAEDLAQRAYENLLSVKREGTASFLESYLYKTAINLAINRQKQQAHIRRVEAQAALEAPQQAPSPEPLWVARERIALLTQALQELPARVRMVFVLREFDELSYEEILERLAAQNIRIDRRTAMRYVERALLHCQEAIDAAERGEGRGEGK